MKLKSTLILTAAIGWAQFSFAQENKSAGQVNGNFGINSQLYQYDSLIGTPEVPEDFLLNGFANVLYSQGNFTAGIRYEGYLNPMLGYSPEWAGQGIGYRFVDYKTDMFQFTAGNFYEQFGNGQILRAYEDNMLGVDNSIDGFRVKAFLNGVTLTGLTGKQRYFWDHGAAIIRGLDANIDVNGLIPSLQTSKTRILLGASMVSKYQEDNKPEYVMPQNVMATGGRAQISRKGFMLGGEYTYKYNDPTVENGFIYRPGQMLTLNAGYSKKGLGINLGFHTLDNMYFRGDYNESGLFQEQVINFIPALTKQHTYNLMSTLYPYATQPGGEIAFQLDVVKKINRKSGVTFNASWVSGLDSTNINGEDPTREGYTANLFSAGDKYYQDINVEYYYKFDKNNKIKVVYQNLFYNYEVVQGKPGYEDVYANVGVVDYLHKFNKKTSIRVEGQILVTEQDLGSWTTGLVELTYSPHWFVSVMNQYNYGNKEDKLNYPLLNVGYIEGTTRVTVGYGKQREGLFCVGGVCRVVPASSGLTLNITSSF